MASPVLMNSPSFGSCSAGSTQPRIRPGSDSSPTLVFLHERDPVGWAAARSSPEKGAREMISKLPAEIGADVGDVLRDVPDLHHVLAAMLDTIGPIVDSADHAAVFRDLLEEFAAYGGRREGTAFTPRSVSAVMA